MATRYVNTAAAAGGDGTTTAIVGANRAYSTLREWEAARQAVLAEPEIIYCAGLAADILSVTIDGWTTSAANYILITTDPNAVNGRHNGTYQNTKYRLEIADVAAMLFYKERYIDVVGLQFQLTATVAFSRVIRIGLYDGAAFHRIEENILKGIVSANLTYGIHANNINPTVRIKNNIIYDFVDGDSVSVWGIYFQGAVAGYVYNNTIINCKIGIDTDINDVIIKNNITQDCGDGYAGAFAVGSDYNISDILNDTLANSPSYRTGQITNVAFAGAIADNYHLGAADTMAADQGENLAADPNYPFTDDIDGDIRPQGPEWDIGADERLVEAPPSATRVLRQSKISNSNRVGIG